MTAMPSRDSLKMGMEEDGQKVEQLLCMNGGQGETSYAKNSIFQRKVMSAVRHILEESVMELCKTFSDTKSLAVADLGCATGPNALVAVSEIVVMVCRTFDDMGHHNTPCFLLYLNDLPSNDFNIIFRSLGGFYDGVRKLSRECFAMGVPGSFHGRLFPDKSLHFVHSSCALHWLSQVPKGLVGKNGEALNKGNISIAETSSLAVKKAYSEQFKEDFNRFLKSRSEELRPGGSMVLTLLGSARTNAPFEAMEVIALTLAELAHEDLIKESTLNAFQMPLYVGSTDILIELITEEGSFNIRKMEAFKIDWDAGIGGVDGGESGLAKSAEERGKFVARYMRAVEEPLLVAAFGEAIMDELFRRAAVKYGELMNGGGCYHEIIVVSLTRNVFRLNLK